MRMNDFSDLKVLNFAGKRDQWYTEAFLTGERSSDTKDLLMGKLEIPKADEKINEKNEEGKN